MQQPHDRQGAPAAPPLAASPAPDRPVDDWTRFAPPPKTRISDFYRGPDGRWRLALLSLAAMSAGVLLWAMVTFAGRPDRDRSAAPSEPTRIERRTEEAREFLRRRNMEEAPFTRAQEERAKRRGATKPEPDAPPAAPVR